MGARPERCAVVEDTATGVKAGIAAGMSVFGYAGGPQSDAATLRSLGAKPFHRMAELRGMLGA
jgi:beta-phosphoglucomutase-like phosphatase (HAD superfamily)